MTQTNRTEISASIDAIVSVLHELMLSGSSEPSRIAAAKILLERIAPKNDEEERQREADERNAALAEARGLLAEFAALRLADVQQPRALDPASKAATTDSDGRLAGVAGAGGTRLGQDTDGG